MDDRVHRLMNIEQRALLISFPCLEVFGFIVGYYVYSLRLYKANHALIGDRTICPIIRLGIVRICTLCHPMFFVTVFVELAILKVLLCVQHIHGLLIRA